MKFSTNADVNGTSLQGYVTAYYHELIELFGDPELGGDKTTVEWCLEFEDGTVATIYDWKEYETPLGKYQWHIGGHDRSAVMAVTEAMRATA